MNQPQLLGDKYILFDTLGVGGTAEIFRGKLIRDKGFEKLIVIKKLLNHLTDDQKMVSHFIDEARLAALLQHDNIVCIYDFGNIGNEYYIAMEYLFGKDLFAVMKKVQKGGKTIPVEYALFITSKICDAMAYAHELRDLNNRPIHIIHRDLTPHNIFLTYEGKVKVIDFGIAKNELQESRTQVGVVKGKVSYMSPEQVAGDDIDSRSDIFSIGILLYEMLSGKKLYTGNTAQLIQQALDADFTPLNKIAPDLPVEVYDIVDKALQKDLTKRYQKCRDMQSDIENYLYQLSNRVNTRALQEFTHSIFAREFKKESLAARKFINQAVTFSKNTLPGSNTNQPGPILSTEQPGSADSSFPQSNIILIPASAAILLLIIGIIFQFFFNQPVEPIDTTNSVTQQNSLSDTPTFNKETKVPTVSKGSRAKERITALLLQANESYSMGKLIQSPDAAYTLYKNVLYLDEDNTMAQKGLERVANQLDANIRVQINDEHFAKAAVAIQQLNDLFPDHLKTKTLQTYYTNRKQYKINTLNNAAERAIPLNKLTSPAEDCALKYYNEIKAIDPKNPLVQQGYKKIADRYAYLANTAFKNLELETARVYVHEGLLLEQNHQELLRLKDDLNRKGVMPYVKGVVKGIEDKF